MYDKIPKPAQSIGRIAIAGGVIAAPGSRFGNFQNCTVKKNTVCVQL